MTITSGADPDQLDQLATRLELGADAITAIYAPVRAAFMASRWLGGDADMFGNEWDGPSKARLQHTSAALKDAAKTLRQNAQQQRQASGGHSQAGAATSLWGDLRNSINLGPIAGRFFDGISQNLQNPREAGEFLWKTVQDLPVVGSAVGLGVLSFDETRSVIAAGQATYDSFRYGFTSDQSAAAWNRANELQNTADGAGLDFASGILTKTTGVDLGADGFDYVFGTETRDWLNPSHWTFDQL